MRQLNVTELAAVTTINEDVEKFTAGVKVGMERFIGIFAKECLLNSWTPMLKSMSITIDMIIQGLSFFDIIVVVQMKAAAVWVPIN
jgi:hypothetical protein